MEKIKIQTPAAPAAVGPYSQAIKFGNLVYTSGQIPLNPKTGELVGGSIEDQARQIFDNIKAILEAARSSLNDVIKVNVYLTSKDHYEGMNEIFSLYFGANKPARTALFVSGLPKGAAIEADVIAKCS